MASGKSTSDVPDGPVLTHINKRIRSLRKKLKRIVQLEDSIAQGKSIIKNKEQEELLKSKPTIIALVDELEKSRQPLSVAVDEEITLALQRCHNDNDEDCNKAQKTLDEKKGETKPSPLHVDDLLGLIYFGSMFDVKPLDLSLRLEERCWCLAHDSIHHHDGGGSLGIEGLDAISMLSSLMISRPVDCSLVSHKDALQRCIEHANRWICKSEKRIDPNCDFTYADVREMLTKIMGLGYFENSPAAGSRKYRMLSDDGKGLAYKSNSEQQQQQQQQQQEYESSENSEFDNCGVPLRDPFRDCEGYYNID